MTNATAVELLDRLSQLQLQIAEEGAELSGRWMQGRHAPIPAGLHNLAAYLALRHHDLSSVQPRLAALGLSSLGRSEGHVTASLRALIASLSRIVGTGAPPNYPAAREMARGARALGAAQDHFFGPDMLGGSTRIMVTLPREAGTDIALVRDLVQAGMTCARINCAHDDAETWRAMAANVRAAAAEFGRECRVLMDIAGPKCRIETVHLAGRERFHRGDLIALVATLGAALPDDEAIATISFPEIIDQLTPGAEVWFNDGKIGTRVTSTAPGRAELEITAARAKGERLRPEKGVNFPDTELHLDPLTAKDLADLDTVAELADVIGFSFVQRRDDLIRLHAELHQRRPEVAAWSVMLKIETPLAVHNLPDLIVTSALHGPTAVMIARGDLAVELGFARLSEIQEEIMWLCEAAHVPVVWATQVLDHLVSDGLPSRAEATDAAMSQRAECVMLNKGPFVVAAVRFLADVLRRMDRHQDKKAPRLAPLRAWET